MSDKTTSIQDEQCQICSKLFSLNQRFPMKLPCKCYICSVCVVLDFDSYKNFVCKGDHKPVESYLEVDFHKNKMLEIEKRKEVRQLYQSKGKSARRKTFQSKKEKKQNQPGDSTSTRKKQNKRVDNQKRRKKDQKLKTTNRDEVEEKKHLKDDKQSQKVEKIKKPSTVRKNNKKKHNKSQNRNQKKSRERNLKQEEKEKSSFQLIKAITKVWNNFRKGRSKEEIKPKEEVQKQDKVLNEILESCRKLEPHKERKEDSSEESSEEEVF